MSPLTEPTRLVLRRTWAPMDPDAAAYITAVEVADGQALEQATKIAIDNFVLGCKADGIWTAIKASCILAGARTLAGALVPLVGTAPTNVGPFVSGDYNRKTGLVGNGTTKTLDANRASNADPLNNRHIAAHVSVSGGTTSALIGSTDTYIRFNATSYVTSVSSGGEHSATERTRLSAGFFGVSRSLSTGYAKYASGGYATSITNSSSSTVSTTHLVFTARDQALISSSRIAFYSIGESLNLSLLDARVTDLINAFGAAIP